VVVVVATTVVVGTVVGLGAVLVLAVVAVVTATAPVDRDGVETFVVDAQDARRNEAATKTRRVCIPPR
jgi:UPF0716 family protein affecting phage T7 exclusion